MGKQTRSWPPSELQSRDVRESSAFANDIILKLQGQQTPHVYGVHCHDISYIQETDSIFGEFYEMLQS